MADGQKVGAYAVDTSAMSELEKLKAGLDYRFTDPEVSARKIRAHELCACLNRVPVTDDATRYRLMRELFGTCDENTSVMPNFYCDCGKNISVGTHFIANYNVTILDIAPVAIGDWCMIGPNTVITTVGHPLSPAGRRARIGCQAPVTIGDDVWIGAGCVILPGVAIGNNVVIGAGAVVSRDIPDNALALGVPAHVVRTLENDLAHLEVVALDDQAPMD